jgi:hypothetical protein
MHILEGYSVKANAKQMIVEEVVRKQTCCW